MQNEVIEFMDDETEYLSWLKAHTSSSQAGLTRWLVVGST
jgi:hypothetical protein